jgi:hypothetical protein
MKSNHISYRNIDDNCLVLSNASKSNKSLSYYLDQINPNDYWIYKRSNAQKLVTLEELLEFKWVGYILFKKSVYNIEEIETWIRYMNKNFHIQFLDRPFPPFHPKKIIIKK